jgi:3-oxoacyl-[acyl-carrier-protein] synthase-3
VPQDVITNAHSRHAPRHERRVDRQADRHPAAPLAQRPQTLADLARDACARALADAGRRPDEVDRVLVASHHARPADARARPEVAAAPRRHEAGAVDVNAACAGFSTRSTTRPGCRERAPACVLVCGAEALSRITDHEDRSTAVLFGDGAGAVVVAAGELERGLPPFEVALGRRQRRPALRRPRRAPAAHAGPRGLPPRDQRMVDATERGPAPRRPAAEDIDLFVAHQANARIVEAAAAASACPPSASVERRPMANTSSASIPLALWQAERDGRLKPGATSLWQHSARDSCGAAGIISWKERALVCA